MLYVTMHQAMVNYHIMKICNEAKFMRRKMILTILFEQFISGFIRYFDFLLLYNDPKCWSEKFDLTVLLIRQNYFAFCSPLTVQQRYSEVGCAQYYY